MKTLDDAYEKIQKFKKGSLAFSLSILENNLRGACKNDCESLFTSQGINSLLMASALKLKRAASQVNEIVHAVGIMLALPRILEDGEIIEMVSLGAGNTGKPFDVETNLRIAEFKFIDWKGGSESIRQNSLFKDFYLLAEFDAPKQRYLYVIGDEQPLRFLNGRRALKSVMSRNSKLWTDFRGHYGDRFSVVSEYYTYRKSHIKLMDLAKLVPDIARPLDLDGNNG